MYLRQHFCQLKLQMAPIINIFNLDAVHAVCEVLKNGGVAAIPTDTVYGLACLATNVCAVSKLYKIKVRDENKPVAICVGKEIDVMKWATVSHLPNGLLENLLPGSVTLILTCNNVLDKSLVYDGKLGVRIPDYSFIRKVAQTLDAPLALTSANLSGSPSSININEFSNIWGQLDCIVDGGDLGDCKRSASTVVDLSEKNCYRILRNGVVYDETRAVLDKFGLKEKYLV